ncbi:hypothetical protein [Brevibacillus sp. HB2.2]|uniref:hypothetical protein n=1 Tax=Brevibacillus sp. HB2.2 TaxID=2738846 RepID=UPI00156B2485|nr:hypothetical protein [Brevibacillus sp. HB2.2]NRS46425.1 hypothetical protein [Brevibacillus sp. HB2.2]
MDQLLQIMNPNDCIQKREGRGRGNRREVVRVNDSIMIKPLLIVVGSLNATGGSGASTVCHALATALTQIGPYTTVIEAYIKCSSSDW